MHGETPEGEGPDNTAQGDWPRYLQSPELASYWLAAIIESAEDAIISKTLDSIITSWNKGAERLFGYTAAEAVGRSVTMLIPEDHPDEEPNILARLRAGDRIEHYETQRVRKDGTLVDISLTVSPIRKSDGTVIGASKIARDITERKLAEARLREITEETETLNRLGQVLSGELDLQKLVQSVTDAATDLTNAQFGSFFYNLLNESGASYMLYTLSGVPRSAFEHFPMPRATDLFGPTFRGEGVMRLDDVRLDPRYGRNSPYYGMPEGHLPVVSYLSIPVISRSGDVLGGLFFGHSEAGIFTERHERLLISLASQTAVAVDNARLFEAAQRERSRAEAALEQVHNLLESERQARLDAEQANRTKDEFLATLSHELRTPLTAILGWSRLLSDDQMAGENRARAIDTIQRNARLQAQLVDDILDVSRIITGKLRLEVRPTELSSVIEAAVESVTPAAQAKEIRLQRVLDSGMSLVSGDPDRLQQVIWNLLTNAIKFTPKNGRVQVRLERVDSHVEVIVSDTGLGIKPDVLPFIFERFRQADSTTTRKHGGLGLGLAIVRHLVEMHGGTVEAESEGEGKGATFTVKIPLIATRSTDFSTVRIKERAHPTASSEGVAFDCPPALDGLHVLVVDDEEDTRLLVSSVLEQCAARVTTAGSAAEGLDKLKKLRPDVLLSDLGMPEEDGYSLIEKVRALPPEDGGRTPAAALTAYARVEDRMKVLRSGFQIHLPKPVEPAELVTVVASLAGWAIGG